MRSSTIVQHPTEDLGVLCVVLPANMEQALSCADTTALVAASKHYECVDIIANDQLQSWGCSASGCGSAALTPQATINAHAYSEGQNSFYVTMDGSNYAYTASIAQQPLNSASDGLTIAFYGWIKSTTQSKREIWLYVNDGATQNDGKYLGFVTTQNAANVQCAVRLGNTNIDAAVEVGPVTDGSDANSFICTLDGSFVLKGWHNGMYVGQAQATSSKWYRSGTASAELGSTQGGMFPVFQSAYILGYAADAAQVGTLHLQLENAGASTMCLQHAMSGCKLNDGLFAADACQHAV